MQGLALEGGGAKGAYHIGAYKALLKCGYNFKAVAGASIGAITAAMICQGDLKTLEKLWLELDAEVFNMDSKLIHNVVSRSINRGDIKEAFSMVINIIKNRGIDTGNIRKLLDKYIDEDKIRKSKIKFGLVTLRISDFTPLELTIDEIPRGKLKDFLMASCYLPIFRLQKIIDERYYLDGGYTNVLPITLLERIGCNEIIGVRVKRFGLIKKKKKESTKVTIIMPQKNIGSIILLDKERSRENIEKGYYDTLKAIKKLDGDIYCFKKRSYNLYSFANRKVDDRIKRKLMKKYHVSNEKELTIAVLEEIMIRMNFDIYQVYDPWEVIKNIKKQYRYTKHSIIYNYINDLKSCC